MADLLALKRRVVLAPDDAEARFALAEGFYAGKQLGPARAQLERLLERAPGHGNALRLLSRVLEAQGEIGNARRALERLVESDPGDAHAHESLADAHLSDDRLDDALLPLLEAVRLPPPSPQRYAKAADLAKRTRRAALARGLLERGLLAWPTDAQLAEERRLLLRELGEDDAFDLVAALDDADALRAVRDELVHEDLPAARKALVAASQGAEGRPEYHLLRGELMLLEGKKDRAAQSFDKARGLTQWPLVTGRFADAIGRGAFRRMGVLGWTPRGGAVSPLEAVAVAGKGELFFSGNVRGTGLEAGRVAYNCLKARAASLGISAQVRALDLHLNFTDSDMGKEGLSSGMALTLSGLAAFLGKKLRARLGGTGSITLSGEVQRIDGVHEKLTAAYLDGLERIVMPRPNRQDVEALPKVVRERVEVIFVSTLEEAVPHALE